MSPLHEDFKLNEVYNWRHPETCIKKIQFYVLQYETYAVRRIAERR